ARAGAGAAREPRRARGDGLGRQRPNRRRSRRAGRRAHGRDGRRRRRRAGRLHDRSLRGRWLLPRAYAAWPRREPERAGHALRAAALRGELPPARPRRVARARGEPLLRLRGDRAAGAARRVDRARADRPRPVAVRVKNRTRTMRLLVILDPLPQIKTYKDTTYAMMVEAAARGHALYVCEQHRLSYAKERAMVVATPLEITDTTG